MSWPSKSLQFCFIIIFSVIPLLFLPFTSELFEFNKMVGVYLSTLFILFFWGARCLSEKQLIFRRTILDFPLGIFLAFQLLSSAFSIDPRTSFLGYYSRFNGGFLSLLCYSLLYWAAVSNLDRKSTLSIINWSVITSALVAAWGVAEHFGADAGMWVQDVKSRVFSTLGQPNWLAAYLVALIFIPLSSILNELRTTNYEQKRMSNTQKKYLTAHVLLTTLLFIVLLYTKSRSGLLAFGISSIVFWFLMFKNYKLKIKNYFLAFSLLTLSITLLVQNPIRDLLFNAQPTTSKILQNNLQPSGTSLETGGTESGTIRKIVWQGALGIWRASPKNFWLGSGPETFAQVYYQHRPLAHNATSEWELLYNKAHNEFLNYLATTGLLGFTTYALLLLFMAYVLSFRPNKVSGGIPSATPSKGSLDSARDDNLRLALLAGWLSISVTNFWGFSVVIVQLFLFLFPALTTSLNTNPQSPPKTSHLNFISLIFLLIPLSTGLYFLGSYWIADINYAAGQKSLRSFTISQDPQYVLDAYQSLTKSYNLNSIDPPIMSELGNTAAYMSLLLSESDATSAAEFAQISLASINKAISGSPYHPNYYKSAARSLIILGTINSQYFVQADSVLSQAQAISPTDPRLPYNRGVIAKYLNHPDEAKKYFQAALILKPDFFDALNQLSQLNATPSSSPQQ